MVNKRVQNAVLGCNLKNDRMISVHFQGKKGLNASIKSLEENNRMGKTRDLFKRIRDTKGTFHAKMGTIN